MNNLQADSVYHPSGGMNIDSNGIMLAQNECISATNVKITQSEVRLRNGSTSFGTPLMTLELSGVSFKPTYDFDNVVLVQLEEGEITQSSRLVSYTYDEILQTATVVCQSFGDFSVGTWVHFYADRHRYLEIGSADIDSYTLNQPSEDIVEYAQYVDPIKGHYLFALCANTIYLYVSGIGWEEVGNSLVTGKNITQWSSCTVIDEELGTTIVLAGSTYVQPGSAQAGGSSRILVYFDPEDGDYGLFRTLEMTSLFPVSQETATANTEYMNKIYGNTVSIETGQEIDYGYYVEDTTTSSANGYIVSFLHNEDDDEINVTLRDSDGGTFTKNHTMNIYTDDTKATLVATFKSLDDDDFHHYVVRGIPGVRIEGHENYNANMTTIEPGSFVLRDNILGVYATCGSTIYELPVGNPDFDEEEGELIDCYKFIPASEDLIYDGDSWIRVDGKEGSTEITIEGYPRDVICDYDYNYTVTFNPSQVAFIHNALVFANTYEDANYQPWRVRHSRQGDITRTRYSWYSDVAQESIVGLKVLETAHYDTLNSQLYVYSDSKIYRGIYQSSFASSSDYVSPFFVWDLADSEGILSFRTVANMQGYQIFLGSDDVYIFDGVRRTSLTINSETGASRIREDLFSDLDFSSLNKTFAVYDLLNKEYKLHIQTITNSEDYAVICYVYNLERGIWTKNTVPKTSAAILTNIRNAGSIANLVGTIYELGTTKIHDLDVATGNTRAVIFARTSCSYIDSSVGTDGVDLTTGVPSSVSYTGSIITRDFMGGTLQHQDRVEQAYLEVFGGDDISISYNAKYSTDPSEFLDERTFYVPRRYKVVAYHPDVTAFRVRFLITLKGTAKFRWMQVFSLPQQMNNE